MLWSSVVKLTKKFNSTSFNLKQEAFIRRDEDWPEEGWYLYRNWFDTLEITRWTVNFKFTPPLEVDWSVISATVGVSWLVQLSLEVWWHVFTPLWLIFEMKGMTLLNSCQVIKSWPIWINCLSLFNKFFALQALLECLGILFNKLDLKDPISLNWVRFRPGVCDGGACSSTDSWACERRFTREAKEPYTFEGWTPISTGTLVKCLSHTALTPSWV